MKLDFRGSLKLAREFASLDSKAMVNKDIVICPSTSNLLLVAEAVKESNVSLGVQDVFWEDEGSYTGCESPKFLHAAGCSYAIIGHSERRKYLGETDEMANKKVKAALSSGITPILCVGETFEERRQGMTDKVILNQAIKALASIDLLPSEQIVIVYEPVWAISGFGGRAVEPQEAEHGFRLIHQTLVDLWPLTIVKNNARIIYGGSVDAQNAAGFINLEHFGGFLVGVKSLQGEEFARIVKSI